MSTSTAMRGVVLLAALAAASCGFAPDLTRFAACDDANHCGAGLTCILPERRCVPDCLDCEAPQEDAGGEDARFDGGEEDAGTDAGETGEEDAGLDAGMTEADAGVETDAGVELEPLSVATLLGHGIEGIPFEAQVRVDGGTAPYLFMPSAGSVPSPMTLEADGTLRGTPAAVIGKDPRLFILAARVEDASDPPLVADASVSWSVHPVLRLAGPAQLAVAWAGGGEYQETVSAHGGVPPYVFSIESGQLPSGFSMGSDGVVQGSSGSASSAEVTVRVEDSAQPPQAVSGVVSFSNNTFLTVQVSTRALPTGRVGFPYSYALQAAGGARPYTWVLDEGSLPGMTLSASGLLSGTPTQPGQYALKVKVNDDTLVPLSHSRDFTLIIH